MKIKADITYYGKDVYHTDVGAVAHVLVDYGAEDDALRVFDCIKYKVDDVEYIDNDGKYKFTVYVGNKFGFASFVEKWNNSLKYL